MPEEDHPQEVSKVAPPAPAQDYPFALAAFAAGLLINLVFARMGFQPLDMSIVFDGGWRILSGQVPWRDFVLPYGSAPAAMQAVVFALAGRTWFAYCLHASVINGAFAVVLYLLLVVLRLPRPLAFLYALCASFFFYPPVGVPFMEQHSFFFSLAAIAAAVGGNYAATPRMAWWLWSTVPALCALAWLSKPVPFAFTTPALLVALVAPARTPFLRRVTALATGLAAVVIAGALALAVLRVSPSAVYEQAIARPAGVAETRLAPAAIVSRISQRYDNLPAAMRLTFIGSAVFLYRLLLVALPLLLASWLWARRRAPDMGDDLSRFVITMALAPLCYFASLSLGFVANNQTQNSVAFYPVGAALLHAAVCAGLRIASRCVQLGLAGRAPEHRARMVRPAYVAALVGVSIVPVRDWTRDTVTWTGDVNMTRMVNDMTFDARLAVASRARLPPGMEFVQWTPSPPTVDLESWRNLVLRLRARDCNFLMLGDTLVTYGLLGKPSVAPNLWFHPGLSMPAATEPAFAEYERELLDRIDRYDVRCIVVEGEATRMQFNVADLRELQSQLASSWTQTQTFGAYRLYER